MPKKLPKYGAVWTTKTANIEIERSKSQLGLRSDFGELLDGADHARFFVVCGDYDESGSHAPIPYICGRLNHLA